MNRVLLIVLMCVLSACGTPSPSAPTPNPRPPAGPTDPIIPPTTKISDPDTRSALTAYDRATGTLRFSTRTPTLAALNPGDVLVSSPSSAAPDGYLRKVTTVRVEGAQTVVETTQAQLTDAVSQGVLEAHVDLTPAQVQRTDLLLQGVTITPGGARVRAQDQVGVGEHYAFSVTFNHVFVPQVAPNVSGQVTVDGSVSYNVGLGVSVGVSGPSLIPPRLPSVGPIEASVGFAQQARLHISGDITGDLGDEVKFATQYYEPLTFFIGPVPVVVVPRLDLYLSAGGRVEGKFDFQAQEGSVAQLGARWTPDDGWKNISDFEFSGDVPTPTVFGSVKPTGGVKSTFGFKLYDVAGPEMSLLGGLELDGQVPRDPTWIVNGVLKGHMNFKVELPILGTLADYQVNLFDQTQEFARAGNTPPDLTLTDLAKPGSIAVIGGPKTAFLGLRVPAFMGNGCVAFGGFPVVSYFIATDLEDGCGVGVTVVSDVDGPLPTKGSYAFSREGQRRITITVRDHQGTTASRSFFLYIANAAPTVALQAAGEAFQGEPFSVAALIEDPNEVDVAALCVRSVWTVDAPDTLSANTGCLQTVTFGVTGARQVRVTTTDSDGAATSKAVTVTVQPPPADPYPRVVGGGVYARDRAGSGAFQYCVDVNVGMGATIDLSQDGCTVAIAGDPPRRFSARVAVDNPRGEALTYDWQLVVNPPGAPGIVLVSATASTQSAVQLMNQTVNGVPISGNAAVDACTVTVKVNAPDPSRSKGPLAVWTGMCHYIRPSGAN